jgi:hypothetical protein
MLKKKSPSASDLIQDLHLPRNLVSSQKIIGIQPLNLVSLTERKSLVSGCCSTLVFLGEGAYRPRLEHSRDLERLIGGAIINNDDFLWLPRLRNRRAKRVRDPLLDIEGRNEN